MTHHVFISYSTRDADFASRLERDLNSHGIVTWRDKSGIAPGENWHRRIVQELDRAYAVVSIVTVSANASEWVEREGIRASQKRIPIIPVLPAPCDIPFYMQEKQPIHLDLEKYQTNIARLISLLHALDSSSATLESHHFPPGSYLGRMRILELVYQLSLAAIYRVEMDGRSFLCKVASFEHGNHIIRESAVLLEIQQRKLHAPAYLSLVFDPLQPGKPVHQSVRGDETYYYYLVEDFRAPTLRDVLTKNPQP